MFTLAEKSELEMLAESLFLEKQNVWDKAGPKDLEEIMGLGEEYKEFLNNSKTEREAVSTLARLGRNAGFRELGDDIPSNLKPGDRFFKVFRDKVIIMGIIGRQGLEAGLKLIGSHIDTPRLDLKPNPLYEKRELALFKTHYYGGIKKYQWTAMPLALHGVVILSGGEKLQISLGEEENEPVLTITDLLPHLSKEQGERKLEEGIKGEELNVLVGSIPLAGEDFKEKVKLAVLKRLNDTYGILEEDFTTAELQVVPAGKARDVGLDRSLVGAYGQDDRICAFASFAALTRVGVPGKTSLALFMDKEEIGSMGNTGMQSRVLEDFLIDLAVGLGCNVPLTKIFYRTEALSADVTAAIDPTWESVMDEYNSARIGGGVCLTKYTGSKGKAAASDANAEFAAKVRRIFRDNGVIWQTGELGKVDAGGGGTIAQFLANLNMDVIDCGMPVLSMHSPFEVTSKGDLLMGCRAYAAFWGSV